MGYGQEKESTTAGLAKMNAVLHRKAEITIKSGNTFSNPQYLDKSDNSILERFDYIVANPPFSMKNWRGGIAGKEYGRFEGYWRHASGKERRLCMAHAYPESLKVQW